MNMGLQNISLISKGPNHLNEILNKRINDGGKIHITPSKVGPTYILRFAVCSRYIEVVFRVSLESYKK